MKDLLHERVRSLMNSKTEFDTVMKLGIILNKYKDSALTKDNTCHDSLTDEECSFLKGLNDIDLDFTLGKYKDEDSHPTLTKMLKLIVKTYELDTASLNSLYLAYCNTSFAFIHFIRYECVNLSVHQVKLLILIYIYCNSSFE